MARLWFVLLLALSLWPSGASASTAVAGGAPDEYHADSGIHGSDAFRAPGGLGSIPLHTRGPECSNGCSHRSHGGAGDLFPCAADPELLPVRALPRPGPGAPRAGDDAAPLCERLPYHATAPPSSR